jgi:hypothetical protein
MELFALMSSFMLLDYRKLIKHASISLKQKLPPQTCQIGIQQTITITT